MYNLITIKEIVYLRGGREENVDKEHSAPYNKEKATPQVNQLIDGAIRGLCKLNKPFKYCVTAVLMQNNGAGMNSCGIARITQF
jgi:hypothetical protein